MTQANATEIHQYPVAEKVMATTHTVENQPPMLENYNQYHRDLALIEAVHREGAAWAEDELAAFGATTGSREKIERGMQANANKPTLAAAQEAIRSGQVKPPEGLTADAMLGNVATGYAITYIFGLAGLIATIKLLPKLLGIDLAEEAKALEAEEDSRSALRPVEYFTKV